MNTCAYMHKLFFCRFPGRWTPSKAARAEPTVSLCGLGGGVEEARSLWTTGPLCDLYIRPSCGHHLQPQLWVNLTLLLCYVHGCPHPKPIIIMKPRSSRKRVVTLIYGVQVLGDGSTKLGTSPDNHPPGKSKNYQPVHLSAVYSLLFQYSLLSVIHQFFIFLLKFPIQEREMPTHSHFRIVSLVVGNEWSQRGSATSPEESVTNCAVG